MTPERLVGIGFVVLLHVIVISAIVSGLTPEIIKIMHGDPINVRFIPTPPKPQPIVHVPTPTLPTLRNEPVLLPPVIDIARDAGSTITVRTGPTPPPQQQQQVAIADTAASGVTSTHTIPPYPMTAVRLSEEGRVMLHLTISAEGSVASASVTQSSGFTDLDQSAIAWVLAHWKYKPATRGGVAVASATDAAVVFSLKNAR
jgi:protein TonB